MISGMDRGFVIVLYCGGFGKLSVVLDEYALLVHRL